MRLGLLILVSAVACREEAPCAAGEPPYLTVFMVDGMARLIDEGLVVERAVTAFPSMTGFAFSPFITGRDALASGLTGLRWLDRGRERGNLRNYVGRPNVQMNRDIAPALRTIYEEVGGQCTTSFNTYFDRGVSDSIKTGWDFTMAKTRGHWWLADFLAVQPLLGDRLVPTWEVADENLLEHAIDDLERRPKVQWITFPSLDTYSHINGVDAAYAGILRNIDRLIGRYREASARHGTEADRVYAVVTDHGVADATTNIDLRDVFTARGLTAHRGEAVILSGPELDEPLADLAETAAVVAINGNMMCHVYLRHPEHAGVAGWQVAPERRHLDAYPLPGGGAFDVVRATVQLDGVELVVARDASGGVEVWSRAGRGRITTDGDRHGYRVLDGADPLGYAASASARPLADGELHPEPRWLAATIDTTFPYAVPRLARLMAAAGTGELVVTSVPGTEMGREFEMFVGNYRGGHGGLRADQMIVPAIVAGPGVPAGARRARARTEDVGATLRALLGLPRHGSSDEGAVLVDGL